jgi:hypothetical protein
MIELGSRAKDKISGFEGIAVCRSTWLYGCDRYTLWAGSLDKDGKIPEGATFDEQQLEVLAPPAPTLLAPSDTGGPRPSPQRTPDPER